MANGSSNSGTQTHPVAPSSSHQALHHPHQPHSHILTDGSSTRLVSRHPHPNHPQTHQNHPPPPHQGALTTASLTSFYPRHSTDSGVEFLSSTSLSQNQQGQIFSHHHQPHHNQQSASPHFQPHVFRTLSLPKMELDKANKDKTHFSEKFMVKLYLTSLEGDEGVEDVNQPFRHATHSHEVIVDIDSEETDESESEEEEMCKSYV